MVENKMKTLANLKKNGYALCEVENMVLFSNLRNSFVKNTILHGTKDKNIFEARKALAKMSKSEINKATINFITSNKGLSEMMINSFPTLIEELCGKELFIQRRAYLW